MMTPLETRVALNAIPSQGPVALQEQAGMQYRQLQELKNTAIEAKTRDSKIQDLKDKTETNFKRIENPGDENPRKQEFFNQQGQEEEAQSNPQKEIYYPADMAPARKNVSLNTGKILDVSG